MSYHSITRQAIELDGARLTLYSKPGLVAWDEVAAATALLAAEAPLRAGLRVLVWDSPALALFAAQRGVETHLYADNLIALEMARAMQRTHSAPTLVIHDERALPPPSADFDLALLLNPKGRAYARLVACAAYHALKNGGRLLFCGANASGAKVFAADAGEVFGKAAVTVRNKARQRLSSLIKAAHAPPPDADWQNAFRGAFMHDGLTLYTLPGVFSRDALDTGTAMLLATLDAAACTDKRVLDVGCGCGVIGLHTAQQGAAQVTLSDVSLLALECARASVSASAYGEKCRVVASDLYGALPPNETYDLILANPPFHAGHSVDTQAAQALIAGAREKLAAGGALRLVANRFLAYDAILREVFPRVRVVREDTRYRVLEGRG